MTNYEKERFNSICRRDLRLDVTVTPNEETVWLTQDQMALLFNVDRSGIARHINNILKSGELEETTSVQILHESKNPKTDHLNITI